MKLRATRITLITACCLVSAPFYYFDGDCHGARQALILAGICVAVEVIGAIERRVIGREINPPERK